MDKAIDLVSAFLERGLDGLRDAIRQPNERQDMNQQYDNSNELALWKNDKRGVYSGGGDRTDLDGTKIDSADLVPLDAPNPKAPFARLWIMRDGVCQCVTIWNNDGKLGGKITVDGSEFWVNIFKNDKGSGPPLRVKFKAVEEKAAAGSASDDLPF